MRLLYKWAITTLLTISACALSQAQDKHIDPSPNKDKHTITFGRSKNMNFSAAQASAMLQVATSMLQTCDNKRTDDQDVACMVQFEMSGSVNVFDESVAFDIINTEAEMNAALNNNTAFVKVVTLIEATPGNTVCGVNAAYACARTPGSSIVMEGGYDAAFLGKIFAHEFGHTQGLPHRDADGAIMHTNVGALAVNEINLAECAKFHNGFNVGVAVSPNRPVTITFVVDDTGSMGEEIGAVRNGITAALNILAAITGNSCNYVYRLVTFKDNVTPFAPTTDLNIVRNQVAALFASGGGDCPEASVEAVEAIQEQVKDDGYVFLFTDASPHAGTNIEGVKNALRARGVGFYTLLSGDCFAAPGRSQGNDSNTPPFSDNHDAPVTNPTFTSSTVTAAISPNPTAIEAFSYLANETGGLFVYIPEVNSSNPVERLRYENIATNIILGAIAPSIINAEPFRAPRGGTLLLTVRGSNTHFNSSTIVSFSTPGITVTNTRVLSPTVLEALITVSPFMPLGYYDILSSTTVGVGTIETTYGGKGLVQVTAAPTAPTILSVTPSSVYQGSTIAVQVNGINTHFNSTSVPNFGSGIEVLSISVASETELTANLAVAPDAIPGLRNVTVTTGSEVATENVPGPLLVISRGTSCDITVTPDITDLRCFNDNSGSISLEITGGVPPYTYQWSDSIFATHLTNVRTGLAAGPYGVVVTDAAGCKKSVEMIVGQPPALTCSISATPNPTVPGHSPYTIYRGYGPQTIKLTGSGSGGTGTLQYSWGPAGIGPSIMVSPTATTTYKLSVVDANGCVCTQLVTVNVVDVRCGNKNDKVKVCHKGNEICIAPEAVAAHLAHGDMLGSCMPGSSITTRMQPGEALEEKPVLGDELKAESYPNPFSGKTRIQYTLPFDSRVTITVYDMTGRTVATLVNGQKLAGIHSVDFDATKMDAGSYRYRIVASSKDRQLTVSGNLLKMD